ncbi:STAS domain-containing protein [Sphaerisporangium siamense]|uniref:STAS domain-containing protein n=2 Tax=Sphaerisporangium siamense TaxID=795645 RepID=UPI00289333D8|nr:STAS domain-containing protein [Sphaerisporangium siamense]
MHRSAEKLRRKKGRTSMPASQHGPHVEIRVERLEHCTVLSVVGEFDFEATPMFYAHIDGAWPSDQEGPRVVIDLHEVRFCDSAGLGALVYAFNQVTSAKGRLLLAAVPPHLRRRMRISGLERHLQSRETVEQAVKELCEP